MKQSEAKDFLPLIQAWAEGKTLQWQSKGTDAWIDIVSYDDHTFGGGYKYRIKPEPREWYEVNFDNGFGDRKEFMQLVYRYSSLEAVQTHLPKNLWGEIIKVSEVIK